MNFNKRISRQAIDCRRAPFSQPGRLPKADFFADEQQSRSWNPAAKGITEVRDKSTGVPPPGGWDIDEQSSSRVLKAESSSDKEELRTLLSRANCLGQSSDWSICWISSLTEMRIPIYLNLHIYKLHCNAYALERRKGREEKGSVHLFKASHDTCSYLNFKVPAELAKELIGKKSNEHGIFPCDSRRYRGTRAVPANKLQCRYLLQGNITFFLFNLVLRFFFFSLARPRFSNFQLVLARQIISSVKYG